MRRFAACHLLMTSLLGLSVGSAGSAEPPSGALSLAEIFSPDSEVRVEFGGVPAKGLVWSPEGSGFLRSQAEGTSYLPPLRERIVDGSKEPLFDQESLTHALSSLPDVSESDAKRVLEDEVQLSPFHDALLIERADDLYSYTLTTGKAIRLTHNPEPEELARFSPDGRYVSFVRQNDLFVVRLKDGRETALTHNGSPDLLNGKLDWVYQEEVYGRGDFKAYWWSPDSNYLAFLQLDESPVNEFTLIDHLPTRSRTEIVHYPKAGDPNPKIRMGLVKTSGGKVQWVDTSSYQGADHLIVRVGWTPDSSKSVFFVQDRQQTWLDFNLADPETGSLTTLIHETSPAFVDRDLVGRPFWLEDGSFLWLTARTGYHHLYHFEATGALRRRLTDGPWEVREIYGIDPATGWVYFAASEHSPIEVHIYRIQVDGSNFARLSRTAGTHRADFDPTYSHYLDTKSDIDTPPRVLLHRADGREVRVVDDNPVPELQQLELPTVEFLQVPAPDGFVFEAAMIRPPDFDPDKSYPVFQHNYGGPHAQTVRNSWGGSRGLWLRYLAQEGFVVWMCDNRSASAKGIWPTWEAHGKMGVIELEDLESCLSWLKQKPWIDATRVAIHGGSYGGFMASFALTHSQSFKLGIAFAPVTDWRLYDSIYTERYMGLPENNTEGYSATSVVEAADRLHGKLLLIHGTMDDNVHLQNTIQLANGLQQAGEAFELMLYPNSRHGVRDQAQIFHLYNLKTRFLLENL